MKTWLLFNAFYAFVSSSSTFALAADNVASLNQNIIRRQINQEQSSDFDRLNQFLEDVVINIEDDMVVSEKVAFVDLNLVVDSLTCRDFNVGDIAISYSVDTNGNSIDVDIALNGIDAVCNIVYQYEYGFLKGTGNAEILTDGNAADTSMNFITNDENEDFSVTSSITRCLVDIEINDMNFIDADFASNVVGLFEKYLRDLIETKIEEYACSQLSTTGVTFLNDNFFTIIKDTLMGFATLEDTDAADGTSLQSSDYDATQMINFREISESQIGDLLQRFLNQLDQLFGNENDSSNDLAINNLLRSYILDVNGALVVNITELLGKDGLTFELHDEFTETMITLEEVRINGLDSMTKFEPFIVFGDYTLRNEFSWNSLNMEINVLLDMQPSSLEEAVLKLDADSEQAGIVEQITIKISAEKVDVLASFLALIDVEALGGLTIGSLLSLTNTEDYSWLLSCLMSALQEFQFVELEISAQQIYAPTLEGFIDDGLDRILSELAEISFEIYHDVLLKDILPIMIRNPVKESLNTLIAKILEGSRNESDACPKYDELTDDDDEHFVDFREFFGSQLTTTSNNEYGKLPSMLVDMINKELLENNSTTGMPKINEVLIDPLTEGQSGLQGTLRFGGDGENVFDIEKRIAVGGFDANVRLSASDVKIENLDTVVAPLILLEAVPTEPHYLNNSITVGVEDRPMRLAGIFSFAITDEVGGMEISNKMDISFDMHTASVLATMMLKIAKSKLLGFPLVDVFDLNCWMATIPAPTLNEQGVNVGEDEVTASIVDFIASVANANLSLNCIECSSPGIVEFTDLLMSSEAQSDVTFLVNALLLLAGESVKGDLLQVQIDRLLNDASKQCRHSPDYDPKYKIRGELPNKQQYSDFEAVEIEDSTLYLMLVGLVSLALILMVAMLFFFIRGLTRRRHRQWLTTLSPDQVEALKCVQDNEASLESALNSTTSSMFQSSEDIPCILRWGMPFVILGNIALFVSGHLNLGATVNIQATIAGETITVDQFFEFSMAKSTIDIWRSGGKELAILILVFSGIWPYTKQFMTLVLWFTPSSWVTVSRRGSILLWLDWMAKWSMIDIFVLIICLAAFRVSANSPSDLAFLPEGFYSLDILVVPLWGLYANMIAQLVSQLSSHFIIHYHRKIAERARDDYLQSNGNYLLESREELDQKVLLRTHQFGRPHRGEEEKLVVRTWTNHVVIFLMILMIACIISGCIFPSFSIEIFGLLGVAVEAGQEFNEAQTDHSVFTVIKLLFEQAKFLGILKNYIGLGSFSVIFTLTVLVIPILQSIALIGSWFIPMTKKQRIRLSILIEILQSWQYAEVYVIAIFVASWQLGPISSFMVNSYCGSLDGFFSELVFYGIVKNEDAQCFSIKPSIEEGFFILAIGSILLVLLNGIISKATMQYFRDQDEVTKQSQIQERASKLECAEEGQEGKDNSLESSIHPPPILFTDAFRWLLEGNRIHEDLRGDSSSDKNGIEDSNIQELCAKDSSL